MEFLKDNAVWVTPILVAIAGGIVIGIFHLIKKGGNSNKQIMQTIFFAAGASYPFYKTHLTTNFLTDCALNKEKWKDVIQKYEVEIKDNSAVNVDDVTSLIANIQQKYRDSTLKTLNFEILAEIIDKLVSYGDDETSNDKLLNFILHFYNVQSITSPLWHYVPFLYREIISQSIIQEEESGKVENYEKLQSLQQKFVRKILSESEKVSVISLNYDETVPITVDNIPEIDNCFAEGQSLDLERFLHAEKVAYYPHGQLRFVFTDKLNVDYYKDYRIAEEKRWAGLYYHKTPVITSNNPFCYDFNTFTTTGQTKDNAFNNKPYSAYYQRMACDFLSSDIIYIIGYSFGDAHFNRLLQSFLYSDANHKVLIVDKYDKKVTMIDEYTNPSNIINQIQSVFAPEWEIMVKDDKKLPINPKEVERINNTGYGQIFKNVYFYKEGYEKFLSEFDDVVEYVRKPAYWPEIK